MQKEKDELYVKYSNDKNLIKQPNLFKEDNLLII